MFLGYDEVADLGPCVELRKLDLHQNALTSVVNVCFAVNLTMLNMANNQLRSIAGACGTQGSRCTPTSPDASLRGPFPLV